MTKVKEMASKHTPFVEFLLMLTDGNSDSLPDLSPTTTMLTRV